MKDYGCFMVSGDAKLVILRRKKKQLSRSVLRNFRKFGPATSLKKRPWHSCFPVNFVKFLGTPFFGTALVAASDENLLFLRR